MTPHKTPAVAWPSYSPSVAMNMILGLLNLEPPAGRPGFRRLVEAWQACGRNVRKMLAQDRDLHDYIYSRSTRFEHWRAWPWPDGTGLRLFVAQAMTPQPDGSHSEGWNTELDYLYLLMLLTHPWRDKLSEQPCARCKRYYLKRTVRQKVYCSRKCAKNGTAAFATRKRLQQERSDKLRIAQQEIDKWVTARTRQDWKFWVSHQKAGRRVRLTPKFLTRVVNRGEIRPPHKER